MGQDVDPGWRFEVPAGQIVQERLPVMFLKVPIRQALHGAHALMSKMKLCSSSGKQPISDVMGDFACPLPKPIRMSPTHTCMRASPTRK